MFVNLHAMSSGSRGDFPRSPHQKPGIAGPSRSRCRERCAYLVSHTGSGDSAVFFNSQGFVAVADDEEQFYAILKYLALVEPLIAVTSGLGTESQLKAGRAQIVFSSRPGEFRDSGWAGAFFVGSDE